MAETLALDDQPFDLHEELHGHYIEDLTVGMSAFYSRTSEKTQFGGCIAHGMLTASLISTVVGTKLPGPGAIYLSQSLRFTAPVRAGDTVTARARVIEVVAEKRRCRLETGCTVGGETVVQGEALMLVPSRAPA